MGEPITWEPPEEVEKRKSGTVLLKHYSPEELTVFNYFHNIYKPSFYFGEIPLLDSKLSISLVGSSSEPVSSKKEEKGK